MDGTAIIYCDSAFGTPTGKTANGLVRYTVRYEVVGVIDSTQAGRDAGQVLDGRANGIPIFASLKEALKQEPRYLVIGLAPDGGRLPEAARRMVADAIRAGLNIDSGLHEFLSDDAELAALARTHGVTIRDVRRPPPRSELHFFTGKIEEVTALKLAVLGTDSAIGKRTTAIKLNQALNDAGIKSELIGTGQTSWLQGVKYGVRLDALINDFVTGEIEHTIHEAFTHERPQVILLEGQGSLLHPAYPGGFELIAAGRIDGMILQHAPTRRFYDGFESYPMAALDRELQILELLAGRPVIALTINHEGMTEAEVKPVIREYETKYKIPVTDVLRYGCDKLIEQVRSMLQVGLAPKLMH